MDTVRLPGDSGADRPDLPAGLPTLCLLPAVSLDGLNRYNGDAYPERAYSVQAAEPGSRPLYLFPFGNGAMVACTLAGAALSSVFLGPFSMSTVQRKISVALGAVFVAGIPGLALVPLGISKIRATPTWSLWSIAASCALFTLLYWTCDIKRWTAWATLLRPARSNTLLTCLLPDAYFFLSMWFGFAPLLSRWDAGVAGVVRALGFTLAMLLLSGLLTRLQVRVQL